MKRVLLTCVLFSAVAMANAQPPHNMEPPKAAELQKLLQLDDAQTAKVKKVLDDAQQQRKTLHEKYKPQFEAYRADMKKLHEQTHSQLAGVLTPKQLQALDAMHEKHRQHMGHMGSRMPGDDDEHSEHDHSTPVK